MKSNHFDYRGGLILGNPNRLSKLEIYIGIDLYCYCDPLNIFKNKKNMQVSLNIVGPLTKDVKGNNNAMT